ncbi:MAG: Ig-like domain-containing protein, partial [Pseudomonadota bacterium]
SMVNYLVKGQQLQNVTTLTLGELTLQPAQWTLNAQGTELRFSAAFNVPGLKTAQAVQGDGLYYSTLPAALRVTQNIVINQVTTNNQKGGNRALSDNGGNSITLAGLGLNGNLSVYLLPYNQGAMLAPQYRVQHRLQNGNIIIDSSPKALPGQQYQLVVVRSATGETVYVDPAFLLQGLDDTAPVLDQSKVVPLAYLQPLTLPFSEAVEAASFSVTKVFKDYSGRENADISSRFELVRLAPSALTLRLRSGQVLEDNAEYLLTISGIQDLAGNAASPGSIYTGRFLARDTLAPRQVNLWRVGDASKIALNEAMELVIWRNYGFEMTAVDNYDTPDQLSYAYRLSTGFSAASTDWVSVIPTGLPSAFRFSHIMQQQYQYFEVRPQVMDKSRNAVNAMFRTALREPVLTLESFTTTPALPEEATRVNVKFDLAGDIDMVDLDKPLRQAQIKVDRVSNNTSFYDGAPMLVPYDIGDGSASASFLNPKIRDLLPAGADVEPVQMTARMQVSLGYGGTKIFDRPYTLYLDRTPPEISIVSPEDGDFVALGEKTEVLIKSFDKYGIEQVEVSLNDGAFAPLPDPTKFQFVPTAADLQNGVKVAVRATDPNHNVSPVAQIQVYPYDAEAGAPKVAILSPTNGSTFHEGEPVQFEVQLRNVLDAQLFLDVGGVEAATGMTVTRGINDPERVLVTANMPAVNEDIVVLARVQKANLKGFAFLNAINDDGVTQDPQISLTPENRILTGSQLLIESRIPAGMDDFSADSTIAVRDPSEAAADTFAMTEGAVTTDINAQGAQVDVIATLRDRSGNQKTAQSVLTKQAYLVDGVDQTYFTASDGNESVAFMESVAAANRTAELVLGVNRQNGGYRIATASGQVDGRTSGKLNRMAFSGTHLVTQVGVDGEQLLRTYRWSNGTFQAAVDHVLGGELLGATGENVWVRYGASIGAYVIAGEQLLEVPALYLEEPIRQATLLGSELRVLTETGLYQLGVDSVAGVPGVVQRFFLALPDQDGFHSAGNELVTWNQSAIRFANLTDSGVLTTVTTLPEAQIGSVRKVVADGNLFWIRSERPATGAAWNGFSEGVQIGRLVDKGTRLAFVPGRLYYIDSSTGVDVVKYQAIDTAQELDPLVVTPTYRPFDVRFSVQQTSDLLGSTQMRFETATGAVIPAVTVVRNGSTEWLVKRSDLTGDPISVHYSSHTGVVSDAVALDLAPNALTDSIEPAFNTAARNGARIPLILHWDAAAAIRSAQLLDASVPHVLGWIDADTAFTWATLPAQPGDATYPLMVDAVAQQGVQLQLTANDPTGAFVSILQPQNNTAYNAGDTMTVGYSVSDTQNADVRFAEIELLDFNGNRTAGQRLRASRGAISFRLPNVSTTD